MFFRKHRVQREEIIADAVFLVVGFLITVLALFIFDVHWNFYSLGDFLAQKHSIFADKSVYLWGGLIGSLVIFFIIKLFLFGLKEEEIVWKRKK